MPRKSAMKSLSANFNFQSHETVWDIKKTKSAIKAELEGIILSQHPRPRDSGEKFA